MKVLYLAGSYRKNGNTDRVSRLFLEYLQQIAGQHNETLEFETFYLGHQDISPCHGCRTCINSGEANCPLQDDHFMIKEKMEQADGLLITSPVYVDDVSGIVKNWIDRFVYICHRPQFAGKSAYILTTTGSTPSGHATRTLQTALSTWGYNLAGNSRYVTGALMKSDELKARHEDRVRKEAKKFYAALQRQKKFRPSFVSLMMFAIQQKAYRRFPPETQDYQYWHGNGWLTQDCDYYIPHHAGRIRVLLARLTGAFCFLFVA